VAQEDTDIVSRPGDDRPPPANGDAAQKDLREDPKVFILSRELSEVHLLLDHISANPDTNIAALAKEVPSEDLTGDWIEEVCKISWPPTGSNVGQAKQAALLIKVKDYLNRLSKPASGSTIAFTLLVTQEEDLEFPAAGADQPCVANAPSRSSLACTAYPDLIPKAQRFRRAIRWMSIFLFVWLIITCFLSWYVAYGNAALSELATAQTNLEAAQKRVNDAEAGVDDSSGAISEAGRQQKEPGFVVGYCDQPKLIDPVIARGGSKESLRRFDNVAQLQACRELERREADVERVKRRLGNWLVIRESDDPAARAALVNDPQGNIPSRAASLANIMGTAVLPVFYGILGAGAAIIRSLSRKIKASTLAPRDLHLSLQQLALGAVVGACIGLFIAQPGGTESGDASLLGPVALSGSAISFVAGFGVEAVFQALEALISRIFNIAPAASPAGTEAPRRN
jgi:hypothetical protein